MDAGLFLATHQRPALSAEDRQAFLSGFNREGLFRAGDVLVPEQARTTQSMLVTNGFVCRYKISPEGKRQILAIHIPGDFVDLHSYPLKRLEHSVGALSDVTVAVVPHEAIRSMTAQSPTLTELLWRSTMIDAAMNREWLLNVGTRGAAERIAHLVCELSTRMERVGLSDGLHFPLPMTQTDLGDAVSLTAVHVSRMLRQLREQGLADIKAGKVKVFDREKLCAFACFDPSYLFLD